MRATAVSIGGASELHEAARKLGDHECLILYGGGPLEPDAKKRATFFLELKERSRKQDEVEQEVVARCYDAVGGKPARVPTPFQLVMPFE